MIEDLILKSSEQPLSPSQLRPRKRKAAIAGLPQSVSVFSIQRPNGIRWRVELGKRYTGGKKRTKDFESIQAAKKWVFGPDATKLKAEPGSLIELKAKAGAAAFSITPSQISEAYDAFRRLSEINMTLTEAIDFAIKHSRPDAGIISVKTAIDKAIETKKLKRPSYVADLKKRWTRFEEWLPSAKKKQINTITAADIRKYLTSRYLNPDGEDNEHGNLSVLFSWAVRHNYMAANPCAGIKIETSTNDEPVRILSIAETKHLLGLAQKDLEAHMKVGKTKVSLIKVAAGDLVPWLTIGLFAGLRPEETRRLDWSDIDFGRQQIDLPAKKAKGRKRRLIPMEPNLIEWLEPYRPESGEGKIVTNFRWKFQVLQKNAGEKWNPWPKDCLRHSYGSYHLAKSKNSGETAEHMGHRNSNMLYNHYRDVIKDQDDIARFWQLRPGQT